MTSCDMRGWQIPDIAALIRATDLLAEFHNGKSTSRVLQRLQRVAYVGIEAGAAGVEMREDRRAHARIPEFVDVIGDAGNGLIVALALEEFSDLIGHVDQAVRRRH